jgi:regulator of replication initiation timing
MGVILDMLVGIPLNAVYRERVVDFERKMASLETENKELKKENTVLKAKIAILEEENQSLKTENIALKNEQAAQKNKALKGDVCPYCQEPKGKLLDIKPHKTLGLIGIKVRYYECQNCLKKYDKEQKRD